MIFDMWMQVIITLLVAWAGYRAVRRFGFPAPAMLGSMLAVGITSVVMDYGELPAAAKVLAQAVSGAFIGMQISKKDVLNFKYLMKPFLLLITLLTANTFLTGIVIHKIAGFDYVTSLLGAVAGGVSDISLLSMELDGDTPVVALMQTMRLVGVLLFFPYWIRFFTRREGGAGKDMRLIVCSPELGTTWLDRLLDRPGKKIVFTMALCILTGSAGAASPIPAGAMVLPMALVMGLNITTSVCYVPMKAKTFAQLLAGAVVGCSMERSTFLGMDGRTVLALLILMANYWIVNLVYSLYCRRQKLLDLKSAMLASAPGGATDMSLIAADLDADLTKIALIQVLRAVYAVTVMPMAIVAFVSRIC